MQLSAHAVNEKRSPDAEAQASGLDAGELARDGLTATDRYGASLAKFDPEAETRLRWKIDLAILPLASLMFLFSFIDRANIGNARIAGLEHDLGMAGTDYNAVNSYLYVGYLVFEFPATIACKMAGPGWFLPAIYFAMGLTSIGHGYVRNYAQLSGVRFLLGVLEAGAMPGTAYYVGFSSLQFPAGSAGGGLNFGQHGGADYQQLSRWYRRAELTFRLSLYIVMAPLSGAFGGLLASAILSSRGFGGIPNGSWRLIFVIEGIVTTFLGFVGLFLLTDRPGTARWLSQEERDLAVARLKSERIVVTTVLDRPDLKKLWRGLANPVTAITGLCFCLETVTVQGLSFFCPTIVKSIYPNASVIAQQLYTVPPYIVGGICVLAASYASWKLDKRSVFIIWLAPMVMVGYTIFLATANRAARYVALFLIASTAFIAGPLTHGQVSANVVSDSARNTAIATNMFLGNIGSLVSTWSFLSWDAPNYHIGNGLNLATSSAALIAATGIHIWMHRDNRKRDRQDVDLALEGLSTHEISDLDWRHPAFRWKP